MTIFPTYADSFFIRAQNPAERLDFALSNLIADLNYHIERLPSSRQEFCVSDLPSVDFRSIRNKSFLSPAFNGDGIIIEYDPKFIYIIATLYSSCFTYNGFCVGINPSLYFPNTPFKISFLLKIIEFGSNTVYPSRVYIPALEGCLSERTPNYEYNMLRSSTFRLYQKYVSKYGMGFSIRSI